MASSVNMLACSATLTNRPVLFASVKLAKNKNTSTRFHRTDLRTNRSADGAAGCTPAFFAIDLDDPIFAAGRPIEVIDLWRKVGGPLRVTSPRARRPRLCDESQKQG